MHTILHFAFFTKQCILGNSFVLTSLKFRCCTPKLSSLERGMRHIVVTQQMLLLVAALFHNKEASAAVPLPWNAIQN